MRNHYKISLEEMHEIIYAVNQTSLGKSRVPASILASVMVAAAYAHLIALDDAQDLFDEEQQAMESYEDYSRFAAFDDSSALTSAGFGTDEDYGYYGHDD